MCGRAQGQNYPSVPSIALPLKTFQNHLQNFPMTKTQKILENMLFSFRAKRFNSYYDTAVNTKVRHSVKYENVFKHVHLLYQSLSRLCFFFTCIYHICPTNGLCSEIQSMQAYKHLRKQSNYNISC